MKIVDEHEKALLQALRDYPVLVHRNFCLYHAGERGDDYFDIDRMTCSRSTQMQLVKRLITEIRSLENKGLQYDRVAFIAKDAGPVGLIVLSSSLSQRLHRDVVVIRPWQKIRFDHIGIKGCVHRKGEAVLREGDRILLLDDVITTGNTQRRAIEIAERFNARITGIVCVFARQEEAVGRLKEETSVEHISSIWTHHELSALGFIPTPPQQLTDAHLAYRLAREAYPESEATEVGEALDKEVEEIVTRLLEERSIQAELPVREGLKNMYLNGMMSLLQRSKAK